MKPQAILFDLDGVLYEGERPLPGAAEAVRWVRGQGIPHLFLTNTTSRSRRMLAERLAAMGIAADEKDFLTPAVAAREWLAARIDGPLALFVPDAVMVEFSAFPRLDETLSEGAAAVVLGDLGAQWDFARLNRAFRLLMDNPDAPLVALGMTRYWRAGDGLRLDVGPFVEALRYASGREPVVLGKPARPFYQAAIERLGVPAAAAWMIGDDIRGDIEAAQRAGLHALLVRSGKFLPTDLEQGITPDAVLDSVADLPAWIEGKGLDSERMS